MEETINELTKKCSACQKDVSSKAKKCPYCQSDLRSWFRRHPIITILLVLFIIGIFGNSSSGNKKESKPNPTPGLQEITTIPTKEISKEAAKMFEYSQKVAVYSRDVAKIWVIRSELLRKWPNWTDEDVFKFAATGIGIENTFNLVNELTPPAILISVHQKLLKGLELHKQSVSITNKGLDNSDVILLNEATSLIKEGTRWINDATEEMIKITEKVK